jgi:hypothetical protein
MPFFTTTAAYHSGEACMYAIMMFPNGSHEGVLLYEEHRKRYSIPLPIIYRLRRHT